MCALMRKYTQIRRRGMKACVIVQHHVEAPYPAEPTANDAWLQASDLHLLSNMAMLRDDV